MTKLKKSQAETGPCACENEAETGSGACEKEESAVGRRAFLASSAVAIGGGLFLFQLGPLAAAGKKGKKEGYDWEAHNYGYLVDTTKCIGCNACARACRVENNVPEGYVRTWVERYEIEDDGEVHVDVAPDELDSFKEDNVRDARAGKSPMKAFFVPKLCNHCDASVCSQVCPVGASFKTKDGVVLVDKDSCVGCGYCVQACPYGSRFINPTSHTADKCTFCYHRITKGKLPACVQSCPVGARVFGDLKDPHSEISWALKERRHGVLKPEMGTRPKVYYVGLDQEVK